MKTYNDPRDAVFEELYNIALNDKNVILFVADTGAMILEKFKKDLPKQFYNVGVAEQNAISAASGLASLGKHVFIYGITNFVTLRCFDQIRIDICSMNLPVTILGMGTGYVYPQDGPTHHMLEDLAIMRTLPNLTIWSPSSCNMLANMILYAYKLDAPNYIRFDKGPFKEYYNQDYDFSDGIGQLEKGEDITIITTGIMIEEGFKILNNLKEYSFSADVIDLYRLKPLNENLLLNLLKDSKCIITLEEHTINGGLGSMISEFLHKHHLSIPLKIFGIPDVFHSNVCDRQHMRYLDRIDAHSITKRIILGL